MPDSSVPVSVLIVGAMAIAVAILMVAWVAARAGHVDLTHSGDEKPEWMRTTPPAETSAATKADGEGVQLFDLDPGEGLASPFAEQIEDILRAKLAADPELSHYRVDLGSTPDGSLEISVDGKKYAGIEKLPDARLQELFRQAVEAWKKS